MEWIISDNPYLETWRRLVEFANLDFVGEYIENIHGKSDSKSTEANYKKQSHQVRVCILQAREYFTAAEHATLFTALNHLYYGTVCLASAIMLIRGTGQSALDFLRKSKANAHHGLSFSTGLTSGGSAKDVQLLSMSYVEIGSSGHFKCWYPCLPEAEIIPCHWSSVQEGQRVTTRWGGGYEKRPDYADISGRKWALLDLLRGLPDLDGDLRRYGLHLASSRLTYMIEQNLAAQTLQSTWRIHGATNAQALGEILAGFAVPSSLIGDITVQSLPDANSGIVTMHKTAAESPPIRFPSIRESLDGELTIYGVELTIPEFAEIYIWLFGMSMLSRYFPDLWISCIESRCKSAVLLDRAAYMLKRRIPLLALRALLGSPILISSQRPNWFS